MEEDDGVEQRTGEMVGDDFGKSFQENSKPLRQRSSDEYGKPVSNENGKQFSPYVLVY